MNLEDYDFDRLLGLGYTEKATGELKNACWKGYTAIGTKKKGGRTVPNCVPVGKKKKGTSDHAEEMKHKPLIAGPSAGSPSFAESEDETFDFTRCVRPNGTVYGTAGKCRSGTEEAKLERDPSKDVRRGGKLIGTSPRNMSIDTINEYKARLKDARSPQEAKLLEDTIKSMEAKLKSEAPGQDNLSQKVGKKFLQNATREKLEEYLKRAPYQYQRDKIEAALAERDQQAAKPKTEKEPSAKKVASPSVIAAEERKLATLEKRLAAANEKMEIARGRVSGARLGARTKLRTASQSRANAAADKAITKANELEQQVREQKAKIDNMKGIKPKKPKALPRTANDDRRDRLRKTIDAINERAKRLKESKGADSPEFKRFVQKYGGKLSKLMDEHHKLIGQ